MTRKSLKPHLNQIRTWVQQGRTDAWIAHQLEVTGDEITAFKRSNGLAPAEDGAADLTVDMRAEDDEKVAAAIEEEQREAAQEAVRLASEAVELEGTFDHGEEGYGLWLDPSVADDATYAEHWSGHRAIEVTVEADQIVIRRVGDDA